LATVQHLSASTVCTTTPIRQQENIMLLRPLFASLLASSAMALAVTTPAHADKTDRAHEAIAAAEAKIHTAETLGASTEAPGQTAEARAALAIAREDLKAGHKSASISSAIRASALAETAIGELQRSKDDAVASANASAREGVAAAQDQAAAAQDQAITARQQAAEANARADAAQQSAATSAADAAAARNAAAIAAQTPQVETTVTTQQPAHRSNADCDAPHNDNDNARPFVGHHDDDEGDAAALLGVRADSGRGHRDWRAAPFLA
jgi:hypothetical protein